MNAKNRTVKVYWLILLMAAMFALNGCAPSPGQPADEVAVPTVAGEATPGLPQTGGNPVGVQLEEYTINMPAEIPAGQTSFEVTNAGAEEHSFVIVGQGIEEELERNLQPGETLTLDVNLVPGTYEVYCPVEDHAEEGMRLDLTVTEP